MIVQFYYTHSGFQITLASDQIFWTNKTAFILTVWMMAASFIIIFLRLVSSCSVFLLFFAVMEVHYCSHGQHYCHNRQTKKVIIVWVIKARLYELSAHIQNLKCTWNAWKHMCAKGTETIHEWDWRFYDNTPYFMHNVNKKCKYCCLSLKSI